MELDVFKVLLCHREHITGVCQEHVPTLLVLRHILILTLLEILQFCRIVALYPAGLIQVNGFPTALGIVLVLQTILDNLKLQLTYSSNNLTAIKLINEQLGYTLVHQLVDTLLQLLGLHGVIVLDVLEQLGREGRQSAEMQLFALRQRIANLEDAIVWQTYDVAWPSLVDGTLARSHELRGAREAQTLSLTHMQIGLVTLELTAAHLTEGNTRTVVGVDIGGNLEDKASKLWFLRIHITLLSLRRLGTWGNLHETVQQLLYAEIVQS